MKTPSGTVIQTTFTKSDIPIMVHTAFDGPAVRKVPGYIIASKMLGVHRKGTYKDGHWATARGWVVSHVPTGHAVCYVPSRNKAFAAAAVLESLNWKFTNPLAAAELGSKVRRRLTTAGFQIQARQERHPRRAVVNS
jgi:hypothetical protein